jgi:hypothetical protein
MLCSTPPPSPAKNIFSEPDAIAGEGKGVREKENRNRMRMGMRMRMRTE